MAVAVLLLGSGSDAVEVTVDVLVMLGLVTPLLTAVTMVIIADAPAARGTNVTVRLLPLPPHTPPPVAKHETKVIELGRLSETVTDGALRGPLLVWVSV